MNAVVTRPTSNTPFAAIRQDSAPRKLQINPREERITTALAASTTIEGSLRFQEGVKIDGRVKGDVEFGIEDGLCIIAQGAVVEGNLKGPRALILGEVQGNVEISSTLVLAPSAVVVGNLRCGRFVVYDGASFTGNIETIRQQAGPVEPQLEVKVEENRQPSVLPFGRRLFRSAGR